MSNKDFNAGWKGLVSDARAFTNNKAPDSGNFALWSITCARRHASRSSPANRRALAGASPASTP